MSQSLSSHSHRSPKPRQKGGNSFHDTHPEPLRGGDWNHDTKTGSSHAQFVAQPHPHQKYPIRSSPGNVKKSPQSSIRNGGGRGLNDHRQHQHQHGGDDNNREVLSAPPPMHFSASTASPRDGSPTFSPGGLGADESPRMMDSNLQSQSSKSHARQSRSDSNSKRVLSNSVQNEKIRLERDRLLKEKFQWLNHVKSENTMLMQLLHDVRIGKETIQQEADLLINERNEISAIKLEETIHTFDKILSELPLGEKSTHQEHQTTHMVHQHKSDSVHTLMVNIARRCRAQQEKHIKELIEGIREAEESFLANEDISLKIRAQASR